MKKRNKGRKIVLASLLALLVLVAVTFAVYWSVKRQSPDARLAAEKSQQGAATSSSAGALIKREAFTLFGSVDRIDGNKIHFTLPEGYYEGDLRQRVAILTEATVIDILKQKSEEEKKQDADGVSPELKGLYEQAAKAKQELYACREKVADKSDISKVCLDESNRLYEVSGRISDLERGAVPVKRMAADLAGLKGEMAIKVEADHDIYSEGEFQVSKIEVVVKN